jgi:hypothetical protein
MGGCAILLDILGGECFRPLSGWGFGVSFGILIENCSMSMDTVEESCTLIKIRAICYNL